MGRTAVLVNVIAVRRIGKDVGVRTQRIKNRLCNRGGGTVCTIQGNLSSLKGMGCYGNQIADITISSRKEIHRSSDFFSRSKRNLSDFPIQVRFNFCNKVIGNFLAVSVNHF